MRQNKEKSELSNFALLRQGHTERKEEPHKSPTQHPKLGPWPHTAPGSTWTSQRLCPNTKRLVSGEEEGTVGSHHKGLLQETQQAPKNHQLALGGRGRRVSLGGLSQAMPHRLSQDLGRLHSWTAEEGASGIGEQKDLAQQAALGHVPRTAGPLHPGTTL